MGPKVEEGAEPAVNEPEGEDVPIAEEVGYVEKGEHERSRCEPEIRDVN